MQIPTATYRVQFTPDFGFKDAAGIVGYLANLGITHLYASPLFEARRGSTHGYDGVDPNRLNPQLGTPAEFENLCRTLQDHGMGLLLDIVPNHMAFDYDNRMLMDVLENGPHSTYYRFFDIDWDHRDFSLRGRLLAPFLGKHYAECLVNGEIKLDWNEDGFAAVYYDHRLPLRIESYPDILGRGLEKAGAAFDKSRPESGGLIDMLDRLKSLAMPLDPAVRADRIRFVKQALRAAYQDNTGLRRLIEAGLHLFNGRAGDAESFVLLDKLLAQQYFRLCYWRVACEEINYRRFFTINDLISLCQEKEEVFDHTHALLTEFIAKGIVSGIRIDHIDGLGDPAAYLNRLRGQFQDIYILVEKILDTAEPLPDDWPVQGTTGYEFGANLNALFVRQENEKSFTAVYNRFRGRGSSFEDVVAAGKRRILETQLSGDLDNLAGNVKIFSSRTWSGRDFTLKRLRAALTEMLVRFPVYRTYSDAQGPRKADRRYIRAAAQASISHRPDLGGELDFLQRLLLGEISRSAADDNPETRELDRQIAARFQQLTAPLMAKGFEDTALYVYNRLLSLNEVGGDPARFGCSAADFHAFLAKRASRWPHAMNSAATHDSKRGEDVRARLNVLSELPAEWAANLEQWHAANRPKKRRLEGREIPGKNEEYLLYQTLVGAFPFGRPDWDRSDFIERISRYVVKAAREAKIHTSWLEPNEAHEAVLTDFVESILHPSAGNDFLKAFLPFGEKVARYGTYNSISQTLIKITVPGVPDFYQGAEMPDLNLVDPDNRRAVDYRQRAQLLKEVRAHTRDRLPAGEFKGGRFEEGLKIAVIAAALAVRKAHPRLFRDGSYIPLQPAARLHNHVIAFARNCESEWSITAVPRFLTALVAESQVPVGAGVWQDTVIGLPEGAPARWTNILTGEQLTVENTLALGDMLAVFPAALLLSEDMV
ncbi:MAG: malto-oligosyltrehalose synthase [Desulfobacterales bacterium]